MLTGFPENATAGAAPSKALQTFQRLERQRLSRAFTGFPETVETVANAGTAASQAFTGFQRLAQNGSAHRLSQACQRLFQRLEQQRSQAFSGFQRLSRGCSNGWNGSAHRLSPVPKTVPMVGTVVLTGFHRLQRPSFQRLEQQLSLIHI